jgi:uncharacterized protein
VDLVTYEISADDARRLALHAQGLIGTPDRRSGAGGVLRDLGAVQLDTISVLARSHELVPYARLGAIGRAGVERTFWNHEPNGATSFEYWAHAACVLPVELWPTFGFRRESFRRRIDAGAWGMKATVDACDAILKRLRDEGPLTSTELGGARKTAEWWDWSESKVAVEKLLATGDAVCVERRSWKRVYDLPERALPKDVLDASEPSTDDSYRSLLRLAARQLGVGTLSDLTDYYRLKIPVAKPLMPETGLVPVMVRGWEQPAWADPDALALLESGGPRGRHRTTLLSPFDSLIWERPRMERIFGMFHRIEAYTPAHKRVHGYFAMPVLAGGKLIGRVDPKREGRTLVAKKVSLDSVSIASIGSTATALREAASWVGCDSVRVDDTTPERIGAPLRAALGEA